METMETMETMPTPNDEESPTSALKLGREIDSRNSEEIVKVTVAKDSTLKETSSVHDPNLFTGVTATIVPNLFTGVTAPVPQDAKEILKQAGNADDTEGIAGKGRSSALKEVLAEEKIAASVDENSNPNKIAIQDDNDVMIGGERQSQEQQEQNEDAEAMKIDLKNIPAVNPPETFNNVVIAEDTLCRIEQSHNVGAKTVKVNQNELSLIEESGEADNNGAALGLQQKIDSIAMDIGPDKASVIERNAEAANNDVAIEEIEGIITKGQNIDTNVMQIGLNKTSDTEMAVEVDINDEISNKNGNVLVVQEHDADDAAMKIDTRDIIHNETGKELVVQGHNADAAAIEIETRDSMCIKRSTTSDHKESEGMVDQQQAAGVKTTKIDPNLTLITNVDNNVIFKEEQNTGAKTVENNVGAMIEESHTILRHEQNIGAEAMEIYPNVMEICGESDAMTGKEKNKNSESMRVDPTDKPVKELDTRIQKNDDDGQCKKMNVNTEVFGVEQSNTSITERHSGTENHETVTIKHAEKMIKQENTDAEAVNEEPVEVLVTKESIGSETLGIEGNASACNLILSENYEEKYPAETDMLPPSDVPVENPTPNDILFGRGGLTNHHPGNRRFRDIVVLHKDDYMKAIKIVKPRVARKIVKAIRTGNPPGRFLKKSSEDNKWYDVGDRNAAEKASQALREKSQNEKKETKAKAKARYKKNEDSMKSLGNILSYGNIPVSSGAAMYGEGGAIMPPFSFVTPAMYGIIPPPGVQIPLLPAMPPFAQFRGDSLNSSMKGTYSKPNESPPKATADGKDENEKDDASPTKSKIPTSEIPNENVTNIDTCQSNDDKPPRYPTAGGIFGTTYPDGDIMVTDQDILCGRGGATNHHKGNKRFRDIVAVHRPDYVRAPKVQKPGVARLIVKAIRSGNPAGRFLKKCADGKWFDIGDKRAAEKASQALREKPPDERKSLTQANSDYFTFLAQHSAYGMHAGALQGHTYVYPAYPATIVPQQHINPALQGMQPLFMNLSPSKGTTVPNLSNGETVTKREEQSPEDENTNKECSNNVEVDGDGISDENNSTAGNTCFPSSPKRRKIESCPGTAVAASCPALEVSDICTGTEV